MRLDIEHAEPVRWEPEPEPHAPTTPVQRYPPPIHTYRDFTMCWHCGVLYVRGELFCPNPDCNHLIDTCFDARDYVRLRVQNPDYYRKVDTDRLDMRMDFMGVPEWPYVLPELPLE